MDTPEPHSSLNRLFIQALLRMGDAGEIDPACRLAAQAWSLLRHDQPKEAKRLNDVLHNLTNPSRSRESRVPAIASSRLYPPTA